MGISIKNKLAFLNPARSGCHDEAVSGAPGLRKLCIVGSPNVGKSLIFNRLTGSYAAVSNYPGTTVSLSRGKTIIGGEPYEVIDTPGMYSLLPITEEERVARTILLRERPDIVLNVVDARNLERMLPLTLQLIEAGLPVVLDLNMIDEMQSSGMEIDARRLEADLGIPVAATVATRESGITDLRKKLSDYAKQRCTV